MADTRVRDEGVKGRGVLAGAGVITAAIAFALLAAWALLHWRQPHMTDDLATAPVSPLRASSPVKLQSDPRRDIDAYRAQQQRRLSTYAWVDREHGIVRIPIEQAMQALASGAAGQGAPR